MLTCLYIYLYGRPFPAYLQTTHFNNKYILVSVMLNFTLYTLTMYVCIYVYINV